jgi:cytoskeletal protein RodZ
MYEQNSVEFMGVLVDRQYASGQKYVQLVFETAEGIRLSLSRNINLVRSLSLGSTYKVKGSERTVGQKRYIHEPTAMLVPDNKLSLISKHRKVLIPVAIGLIVVLSGVGVLTYAANSTNTNNQPTVHTKKPASKSTPITTATPTDSQPVPDTASSVSTQQETQTAPVKSTRKSTPVSPPAIETNPVINNVVTPPVTNDVVNHPSTEDSSTTVPTQPDTEIPSDTQEPPDEQTDPTPSGTS